MDPEVQRVVVTPDYCIGIEDIDGMIWCHAVVSRWTARIARAFRHDLDNVVMAYGPPLYACSRQPHGGDHMKLARFVALMGFRYSGIIGTGRDARVAYVRWS